VTFGSLIKTFLPGLVWLIAFGILDHDLALALGYHSYVQEMFADKDRAQTIIILAFPASILVGLLSNVIVFMGLNDWLVRNPFKQTNPQLSKLHTSLSAAVKDQCWAAMAVNGALKQSFDDWTDPEMIIVERIGADKLAYVREQYWYHLEFQLNLLISVVAISAALCASIALETTLGWIPRVQLVLLAIAACAMICSGLLMAARKNYMRHIAKMASLMVALLSQEAKLPVGPSTID
jgi:hypothetical protein